MMDSRFEQAVKLELTLFEQLNIVLSGFWNNLALHSGRSILNHSYGYDSTADHSICFASLPQNSGFWLEMRAIPD